MTELMQRGLRSYHLSVFRGPQIQSKGQQRASTDVEVALLGLGFGTAGLLVQSLGFRV